MENYCIIWKVWQLEYKFEREKNVPLTLGEWQIVLSRIKIFFFLSLILQCVKSRLICSHRCWIIHFWCFYIYIYLLLKCVKKIKVDLIFPGLSVKWFLLLWVQLLNYLCTKGSGAASIHSISTTAGFWSRHCPLRGETFGSEMMHYGSNALQHHEEQTTWNTERKT